MRRKLPQGRVRQWLPIKEYTKTRVEKVGSNSISESLEIERERERQSARDVTVLRFFWWQNGAPTKLFLDFPSNFKSRFEPFHLPSSSSSTFQNPNSPNQSHTIFPPPNLKPLRLKFYPKIPTWSLILRIFGASPFALTSFRNPNSYYSLIRIFPCLLLHILHPAVKTKK